MISRSHEESEAFRRELHGTDIETVPCPLITFEEALDAEAVTRLTQAWGRVDYVIFTSARAVSYFHALIGRLPWERVRVVCAGEKTAAAARRLDIPLSEALPTGGQAAVMQHFAAARLDGKTVVLPRSAAADNALPAWLAERGAVPYEVPLYRPVPDRHGESPEIVAELIHRPPAAAAFTSPSTVAAFLELAGDSSSDGAERPVARFFAAVICCAIGHTTGEALRSASGADIHVAGEHTLEGLARIVRDALERRTEK